jgi:hypothetical protein
VRLHGKGAYLRNGGRTSPAYNTGRTVHARATFALETVTVELLAHVGEVLLEAHGMNCGASLNCGERATVTRHVHDMAMLLASH